MSLASELAYKAKDKGICSDWFEEMKTLTDKKSLVEMYIKGIDFCLCNDFPDNEYIRVHFKGQMEPFGVHLDERLNKLNERRTVALGKCHGRLEVNGYNVSEVFIKHDSDIFLLAGDYSFVMIDIFDKGKIHVIASGNAKVCINHYGGTFVTDRQDHTVIKIIEKHKKTY